MKIINRRLEETADASSARNSAMPELRRLLAFVAILAVVTYLTVGLIVDMAVAGISFETESRLFNSYDPTKTNFNTMTIEQDDEKLQKAQKILDKLTALPETPPLNYRLVIVRSDKPNAFAFPGGTIGVTEGLLEKLDEEIELAFVLGHELGHFNNRDHLRGLGRGIGVSIAYAVLFGGDLGDGNLGNILHGVLSHGYSRKQEAKADNFGVLLVREAYGQTAGIEKLFEILESSDKIPDWAYMLSTHQSPKDRIESLKVYAEALGDKSTPTQQ